MISQAQESRKHKKNRKQKQMIEKQQAHKAAKVIADLQKLQSRKTGALKKPISAISAMNKDDRYTTRINFAVDD